jgi:L-rhamnose-H+ transport protein
MHSRCCETSIKACGPYANPAKRLSGYDTSVGIIPLLLGAGWGIAQILFGISVKRLWMGIAYAIIVGLGAVLGTLVPLFSQHMILINRHATALILIGVAVMVVGISLTALGGYIRERDTSTTSQTIPQQKYIAAVSLAVLSDSWLPC